ncbi:hypothetical protein BpHYR1_004654 [Brachionus plicatilis]|uniref:Uncharacterized protein n=1 Tax=Brachionus plicatilis TaxID=10195 RepID=A0A3M7S7G2_BRAPC|nr:hypothetical protein BpHYR1_004654 [Brachionus plicatilis]
MYHKLHFALICKQFKITVQFKTNLNISFPRLFYHSYLRVEERKCTKRVLNNSIKKTITEWIKISEIKK